MFKRNKVTAWRQEQREKILKKWREIAEQTRNNVRLQTPEERRMEPKRDLEGKWRE